MTPIKRTHGIAGTSSQIICYISDLNKPAIPCEVAKEELTNIDIDKEQMQIVKMVDKDGKMVKKVKPILIKKELNRNTLLKFPLRDILERSYLQMMREFLTERQNQWSIMKRLQMMKTTRRMMR